MHNANRQVIWIRYANMLQTNYRVGLESAAHANNEDVQNEAVGSCCVGSADVAAAATVCLGSHCACASGIDSTKNNESTLATNVFGTSSHVSACRIVPTSIRWHAHLQQQNECRY